MKLTKGAACKGGNIIPTLRILDSFFVQNNQCSSVCFKTLLIHHFYDITDYLSQDIVNSFRICIHSYYLYQKPTESQFTCKTLSIIPVSSATRPFCGKCLRPLRRPL